MRRDIGNYKKYMASQRDSRYAGAELFRRVGPAVSVGPFYLPDIKPYVFPLVVVDPTSDAQLRVTRVIAQRLGIEAYGVELPKVYGDPLGLTNLVTKERGELTLKEFQNYVMARVSASLPMSRRWNPVTMRDNTNPKPLSAETHRLKETREGWLDHFIRTIDSDNLVKLDIDVVVYDPVTYKPKLLAEVKKDSAPPYCNITRELGHRLGVPAGLITYDEVSYSDSSSRGYVKGFEYHTEGFGKARQRDISLDTAADVLRSLLS